MTTIPLLAARAPTVRGAKPILYARAFVALATIGSWLVSAVSGLVLWLSPHGPGTRYLLTALDLTRSTWIDVHIVASFLAVGLTLIHLTVMRSGVRAYLRLIFLGRGSAGGGRRRPTTSTSSSPSSGGAACSRTSRTPRPPTWRPFAGC
jgi:hypothetical protein